MAVPSVFNAFSELAALGTAKAEEALLSHEQVDCPVYHFFGPGMYVREVHMKAGTLAIGHFQTQDHLNVMLKGKVAMLNEDGTTSELSAPLMFTGKPGRKMGYILEDMVWQNIYATTETDIGVLETKYLDKSPVWHDFSDRQFKSAQLVHSEDRSDFQDMLRGTGFSAEIVQSQSEDHSDQCPMPAGSWKTKTGRSPIHGTGVFATAYMSAGTVIGPARLSGMRTPLGRYTNHSKTPNAQMEALPNGNIYLVATTDIKGCAGGNDGDEVTICYRQALQLSGIACTHKENLI